MVNRILDIELTEAFHRQINRALIDALFEHLNLTYQIHSQDENNHVIEIIEVKGREIKSHSFYPLAIK